MRKSGFACGTAFLILPGGLDIGTAAGQRDRRARDCHEAVQSLQ